VFDWNDLRHFLAVARTGSMGAAAKSLGVNQSTIQRRLSALEKQLGRSLVERRASGYALTEFGATLVSHAEQVEAAADAVQRHASLAKGAVKDHLRVASLVTVGQRIIRSGFIELFQARHPDIVVEMILGQRPVDLAKGEADVAIRGGGATRMALVGRKIADLPWGVYASRTLVERHGLPATPADLAKYGVIDLVGEIEKLPAAQWLRSRAAESRIVARCENIPSAHLAVKSGAGLGALPAVHAAEDGDLVNVFGPIPELSYPMYLFAHKDLRKARKVNAFFAFSARELKPVLLTGAMRGAAARSPG
jgi:DNA-binding transcriptional LysR family regulator